MSSTTILYFIEVSCPGGAQNVLLNILDRTDKQRYRPVVALMEKGWLEENLSARGIDLILLDSSNSSFDFKLIKSLYNTCKEFNVKLIHAHLFDSGLYACIVGILTRIPVIVTLHGQIDWKRSNFTLLNNFKRTIVNYGARFIVYVSNSLKLHYETRGLRKDKGIVIYNGIDLGQYFPSSKKSVFKAKLGFSETDILIGSIGNVKPWKGYEVLIKAAEIVVGQYPQVRFLIVGKNDLDEDYYNKLMRLIEEKGLQKKVFFWGYRSDIRKILSALDVYVLTSTVEGFSLSTVEAMAMGVPVIATRCGGPEEIIENNSSGFLIPTNDVRCLADAIVNLVICDPVFKNKIVLSALNKIKTSFSVDNQVEKYFTVYNKGLEK
jgi:glycosyltransferase involved in cell wall biosynthesis